MNDRLIMLEGYEPPATSIKEDGIYDYENLGWGTPSWVKRARRAAANAANAARSRAVAAAKANAMNIARAAAQKAQQMAAAAQAQVRARSLQIAQQAKAQAVAAARSKAQEYINKSKVKITEQTEKAKSVFPVATIQRARADVAKKMSNPKVQMGIAISAAVAANIPLVGEKLANGIMLTNAVALGKSPQEILETTPGLMEYTQSPQYQQLMALANNPTMANFQSMLGQMDAETATMARAMMEEMQQYAGGVTEKVIENAFSIFDLLTEGKLF